MSVELLINIVVICLLVPTIIFAVILNKRLEILRNSRADLGRLIEAFNDATTRAESGIPRLKQAADSAGSQLKDQIQKAQTLRDDLAFMIERADMVVARLENSMRSAPRAAEASPAAGEDEETSLSVFAPKAKSRSRKRPLVESPEDLISSAVSAAEDILRDADVQAARPAPAASRKPSAPLMAEDTEAERSEAERELLKALQSMR